MQALNSLYCSTRLGLLLKKILFKNLSPLEKESLLCGENYNVKLLKFLKDYFSIKIQYLNLNSQQSIIFLVDPITIDIIAFGNALFETIKSTYILNCYIAISEEMW